MRLLHIAFALAALGVSLTACATAMSNSAPVYGGSSPFNWGSTVNGAPNSQPDNRNTTDNPQTIELRRR